MFFHSLEPFNSLALLKKPPVASASENCVLMCTTAVIDSFFLCLVQGLQTVTMSCPASLPFSFLEPEVLWMNECPPGAAPVGLGCQNCGIHYLRTHLSQRRALLLTFSELCLSVSVCFLWCLLFQRDLHPCLFACFFKQEFTV